MIRRLVSFTVAAVLASALCARAAEDDGVVKLQEFIARETALQSGDSMSPLSRTVDGLFGDPKTILEIPRSVTVVTPETMKQLGIEDFSDLPRASAGAQRVNYFGVPGAPQFRGDLASVYFNGMERAYQRNEMPTSFGSLEALDLVRGPAPADFGPTQAGGFVNMIPKSPFFDRARSSVRLTVGSHDHFNTQIDVGGPRVLFDRPAAFRASVTLQKSDTYWKNVSEDYASVYGAGKMQLSRELTAFAGFEYYDFKSNENAGWNRVTQDLIDNGRYIAGEVPDLVTNPANHSTRGLSKSVTPFVSVPSTIGSEPTVFSAVPSGNAAAIIPPASFTATLSPQLRALLGPQGQYTAAYLNAGGPVYTVPIDGSTVLADPSDFANSRDFLFFFDLANNANREHRIKNQFLVDVLSTEKVSSYGYAFNDEQVLLNEKFSIEQTLNLGRRTSAIYGVGAKYTDAQQLQDFDDEPFSRRDITNPVITPNSVVLTGPQRDDTGVNSWSKFNGSVKSDLAQLGLFLVLDTTWTDRFSTLFSVRGEAADFRVRRPLEDERRADRGQLLIDGGKNYWNASLSPSFKLGGGLTLYASAQIGATFMPSQGGVVDRGEGNFADSELDEIGLKGSFFDGKLVASLAGYYWGKERYDVRSGVLNPLRGKGLEFEASYIVKDGLSLTANATASRAYLRGPNGLRFQATQDYYMPLVAGGLFTGGGDNNALVTANNPERIVPGSPEVTVNLFASYQFANGFGCAIGPTWRSSYYHNFDRTLHLPATTIVNANAWYRRGEFEVFLELTNLFSEDWFYGSDPFFAANTIITKAPPIEGRLSLTRKF